MATPVANRTVLGTAYDYIQTVSGAKDLVFKPVKTILDIAHYNGRQTRITENVRNLADDAGTALDFTEIFPKLYDVAGKVFTFFNAPGLFNLGELSSKVSAFVATVFKCLGFIARKGVSMMDSAILKTWESRFNIVRFGWGTFKAVDSLSRDVATTDRETQEKTFSAIKLVFNGSLLALTAFGSVITPFSALFLSCSVLTSSIATEFYGKLTGLD